MSPANFAMICPTCRYTALYSPDVVCLPDTLGAVQERTACPNCYLQRPLADVRKLIAWAKATRGDVDPPVFEEPHLTYKETLGGIQAIEDALFVHALQEGVPNRNGDVFQAPIGVVSEPPKPFYYEHVGHPKFFELSVISGGMQFKVPASSSHNFPVGQEVTVDKAGRVVPFTPETSKPDTEQRTRKDQKNHVYLRIAETISELGTCQRMKVGCVLLSAEGKVAAVGYNGAGPGMPHCSPEHCGPGKRCLRCSHAEENAVANLACTPLTAYVTHEPCNACTRKLLLAGVRHIYYRHPYTSMAEDEKAARQEWLDHYNVELTRLEN